MFRRSLSWSAALRDIRADRIQLPPDERKARCRQQAFAKLAAKRASAMIGVRPLINAGAYDRRAIMCAAVAAAQARRAITGEPWRVCISAALKGTWQAARATRVTALARERDRASRTRDVLRRAASQPARVERAGRAVDFGGASSPLSPSPLTHSALAPFTRGCPGAGASPVSERR